MYSAVFGRSQTMASPSKHEQSLQRVEVEQQGRERRQGREIGPAQARGMDDISAKSGHAAHDGERLVETGRSEEDQTDGHGEEGHGDAERARRPAHVVPEARWRGAAGAKHG